QKIGGTDVEGAKPLVEVIQNTNAGEMKHERTGAVTAPAFPYKHNDLADGKAPRREQLAKWITSKENQYFAKSYVNRLWSHRLGGEAARPAGRLAGGPTPRLQRRIARRVPRAFRQAGPRERLRVRAVQWCDARAGHEPGQRPHRGRRPPRSEQSHQQVGAG